MSQANLRLPRSPNLPVARPAYDRGQQEQLQNALRLYFNTLDESWRSLLGTGLGGGYLHFPHGEFYDTTDQTAASTTTAYVVTINTTSISAGITLSASSKVTVAYTGRYNANYSIQLVNTTNSSQDVDVWFRKNGTDIANSNRVYGLPPRHSSGDPSHTVAAFTWIVDLTVDDYIELVWRASDTGVSIEYHAAGTSPTRPAAPSVVFTMTFDSRVDS